MQKLFKKSKEKKKRVQKNGQVSEISKTIGTYMPALKEKKDE
jgi:hypothetical protein